jgi:hypothetical protein
MNKKYTLPQMELRFSIQMVGEESEINWAGDFMYRRPNLRERGMIEVMRTRLNGDLTTLDPDTAAFNEAISHLRFTIKEFPDWWKETDYGGSLYDGNVVLELFSKCMEFEVNWRKKVHGGDAEEVSDGTKEATLDTAGK